MRLNDKTGMIEEMPTFGERLRCRGRWLLRLALWCCGIGSVVVACWAWPEIKLYAIRGRDFLLAAPIGRGVFAVWPYLMAGIAVVVAWRCRTAIWAALAKPVCLVFYPFCKWWEQERLAWRERDYFMFAIWLFPGVILVGLYRLAFGLIVSCGVDDASWAVGTDALTMIAVLCAGVCFITFYARALAEAKCGELVVYQDWTDFGKSTAWVVALPLGIAWMNESGTDFLFRCAGFASFSVGCISCWTMVTGAFRYNSGSRRWLALFARVGVVLISVFALGRLQEKLNRYKRGELGIIHGVLIPVIVFAWAFNSLVRPMIRTEHGRSR